MIPAGTFVQGEIRQVVRPGRVKGRAELQMSFTSMIFPNGYTVMLPGAVQNTPGSTTNSMKGKEGTIQGDSSKGKDVGTVIGSTIPGAGIGAIADGGKGAAIGAASGGSPRAWPRSCSRAVLKSRWARAIRSRWYWRAVSKWIQPRFTDNTAIVFAAVRFRVSMSKF